VNATNRNSYLNIICIKLVTQVKKELKQLKFRIFTRGFEVSKIRIFLRFLSFFYYISYTLVYYITYTSEKATQKIKFRFVLGVLTEVFY